MGTSLHVCVLGGLTVELDGRVVAWKRADDADLVALLALEPTSRLRRDDVAQRLWPSASPRAAGKALDHAMRGVRKALRDDRAVTVEGDHLRLWPHGALTVDVHLFLASAKHAHSEAHRLAAAALWTGDVVDRPWTESTRTRARLALLALQHALAAAPDEVDLRQPVAAGR